MGVSGSLWEAYLGIAFVAKTAVLSGKVVVKVFGVVGESVVKKLPCGALDWIGYWLINFFI